MGQKDYMIFILYSCYLNSIFLRKKFNKGRQKIADKTELKRNEKLVDSFDYVFIGGRTRSIWAPCMQVCCKTFESKTFLLKPIFLTSKSPLCVLYVSMHSLFFRYDFVPLFPFGFYMSDPFLFIFSFSIDFTLSQLNFLSASKCHSCTNSGDISNSFFF